MQIKARYSHLNGEEYLLVHRKKLWEEIQHVITRVDASACRTKVSKEKSMAGALGVFDVSTSPVTETRSRIVG